jgi:hypothetical protein
MALLNTGEQEDSNAVCRIMEPLATDSFFLLLLPNMSTIRLSGDVQARLGNSFFYWSAHAKARDNLARRHVMSLSVSKSNLALDSLCDLRKHLPNIQPPKRNDC